jgi:hypothetical protein
MPKTSQNNKKQNKGSCILNSTNYLHLGKNMTMTIFKSYGSMDSTEQKTARQEAREKAVEKHGLTLSEDADVLTVVGCSCCEKTLLEVLMDELIRDEDTALTEIKRKLDIELCGDLLSFPIDYPDGWPFNENSGKTEKLRTKSETKERNCNLSAITNARDPKQLHVWYDPSDGNIYRETQWTTDSETESETRWFRELNRDKIEKEEKLKGLWAPRPPNEASMFLIGLSATPNEKEWLYWIMKYTKPLDEYMKNIFGWPEGPMDKTPTALRYKIPITSPSLIQKETQC